VAADSGATGEPKEATGVSTLLPGVTGGADFSPDRRYRYWLERRWRPSLPQFTYVLLNPSRAGANTDDGTSRKLYWITKANGGGGFELVNLFATVDTGQVGLHLSEAVGHTLGENDQWLFGAIERAQKLVVGWGDGSGKPPKTVERKAAIRRRALSIWPDLRYRELWCVGTNGGTGSPRHPGQGIKNDAALVRYIPTGRYP
jgi:hypothetical protein